MKNLKLQPWEMTKDEFNAIPTYLNGKRQFGVTEREAEYEEKFNSEVGRLLFLAMPTPQDVIQRLVKDRTSEHKMIIEQAIKENKPIPEKVLTDYF